MTPGRAAVAVTSTRESGGLAGSGGRLRDLLKGRFAWTAPFFVFISFVASSEQKVMKYVFYLLTNSKRH